MMCLPYMGILMSGWLHCVIYELHPVLEATMSMAVTLLPKEVMSVLSEQCCHTQTENIGGLQPW